MVADLNCVLLKGFKHANGVFIVIYVYKGIYKFNKHEFYFVNNKIYKNAILSLDRPSVICLVILVVILTLIQFIKLSISEGEHSPNLDFRFTQGLFNTTHLLGWDEFRMQDIKT